MNSFKKDGYKFLEQVFNTPGILEEITGLNELHKKMEQLEIEETDDGFDVL
jgi:hypothetical protein